MIEKVMAVPELLINEAKMVDKCLVDKDVLVKEIEHLSAVAIKVSKFRQAVTDLQTAAQQNKGDDNCEAIREAVFTLHTSIKTARAIIDKPPKFREDSPCVKEVVKMLNMCSLWISSGGRSGTGAEGVLKTYCINLLRAMMKKLKEAADSLLEIAGGKGSGESRKSNLRPNAAWNKVAKIWTQQV